MTEDIRKIWRALRSIIKEGCTFAEIKDLVASAALAVEELSHLQQRSLPAKGASKSQLLDAVDDLIVKEPNPTQAIQTLVAALLQQKRHLHDKIAECVRRFGWTVEDGQLRPSDFQVEGTSVDFSTEVRELLRTAYSRFGQGDRSGAMTAVCSALDNVTTRMYASLDLGNPSDSYQQRAVRSFSALENAYRQRFTEAGIGDEELNRMWQNYRGAVNQAAFVLGALRRNASDVHGLSDCPPSLVRHAIDCGTFIIRSITSEMNGDAQQLDALDF
jgi:hypothetical protein